MALNEHNYIPLMEPQLRMCDKMGSTYYCQNSYVLRQKTQHTCESAIYYKMDAKTITKHCQTKFAANVEFTPKVLDLVIPLEIKDDVNITDHRIYWSHW